MTAPPHKIDLHTHILPERWPSWTARSGYAGWVELAHESPGCARMLRTTSVDGSTPPHSFRQVESNLWDPRRRLERMDATGVAMQALSTVPIMFSYWAKTADALALAQLLNDHIAGVVAAHPDRFAGLGTLPMQDPDLARRELDRCVRDLGLRGVQIGTNVNGRNFDDPAIAAVLAHAESLDAAVFVHPWDMLQHGISPDGSAIDRMPRYWLPWLVGMPAETALAIATALFSGLLDRLPRLRICFAHGGGSFPGTIGRLSHGHACRPDLVAVDNPRPPAAYLAKPGGAPARFYVDSLVHDADALRLLLKLFTDRRIMLGSDYPFPLGEDHPGALIESMRDLDDTARHRLLAGTAAEFLALDR